MKHNDGRQNKPLDPLKISYNIYKNKSLKCQLQKLRRRKTLDKINSEGDPQYYVSSDKTRDKKRFNYSLEEHDL